MGVMPSFSVTGGVSAVIGKADRYRHSDIVGDTAMESTEYRVDEDFWIDNGKPQSHW